MAKGPLVGMLAGLCFVRGHDLGAAAFERQQRPSARFGQAPLCAPALAVGAVVRYRRKRWAPTSREGLLAGSALKKSAS